MSRFKLILSIYYTRNVTNDSSKHSQSERQKSMDYLTVVGYIIAMMGSVAFLPQIMVIFKSKSGEGLNLSMFIIVDFVTALISAFCIKSGKYYI